MSFSQVVRQELIAHYSKAGHARAAELAAIMIFAGRTLKWDENSRKYIYEDPRSTGSEDFTANTKTYNINGELDTSVPLSSYLKKAEDKRAFLRGAFMASGTISDPEKEYHFEITAPDEESAGTLTELFEYFDVPAKTMLRRSRHVVYIKDGETIATALNVIEAHGALMTFENIRIEREIRGAVNRKFNCDTANINKSVSASMRQIEDINFLIENVGADKLDPQIADICRVRLEHPDATLEEIAAACSPPIGKSGANHRFRKIAEMAAKIRGDK